MYKNIKKLIPQGKDRPGRMEECEGVTVHNVGYPKLVPAKNFARVETENPDYIANYVGYHFVIDDIECYNLVPIDEWTYHAGDGGKGSGNRKTIGLEIAEVKDLLTATNNAAHKTAEILFDLEFYTRLDFERASQYVYQHNKWSGKDCPNRLRINEPYSWQDFLDKVDAEFDNLMKEHG